MAGSPPAGGQDPLDLLRRDNATSVAPTDITSDSMEFLADKYQINFVGNVQIVDDRFELKADKVTTMLDEKFRHKRNEAVGNVEIIRDDNRATAGRAVFEVETGEITLLDNPIITQGANKLAGAEKIRYNKETGFFRTVGGRPNLQIKSSKVDTAPKTVKATPLHGITITRSVIFSGAMDFHLDTRRFNFNGNVHVVDNRFKLSADSMAAFLNEEFGVSRIEAEGQVVITTTKNDSKAAGGKAVYDVETGLVTLSDNPVLRQVGIHSWGMELVRYNKETGDFSTEGGRTQMRIENAAEDVDFGLPDLNGGSK